VKKKRRLALWLALAWMVPAGSLLAHHSLISFDTTEAVRAKGTVVQFHRINPHSFLVLEPHGEPGQRRWAVEGPSALQLDRRGIAKEALKPGDVVEVCGYLPRENVMWQLTTPDPHAVSLSGRLLNAEVIVMPDGREHSWGDYGAHRCFGPAYRDQHTR
jgi:hypothetical protein